MLPNKRMTPILLAVFFLVGTLFMLNTSRTSSTLERVNSGISNMISRPAAEQNPAAAGKESTTSTGIKISDEGAKVSYSDPKRPAVPVSYDKTTPPTVGCEDIVVRAQHKIIETYQGLLKGVRYANIFGYLETENKGDAAIWSAQQILLSMMGITFMEACRFTDKDCDLDRFKKALNDHKPHSAIVIAGGGNFNDFYWEDQPSRMKMVQTFPDIPIRSFPQSINMTHEDRINDTKKAFGSHPDLQLAARDRPSFNWLENTFGDKAVDVTPNKVRRVLTPDIAFMWGSRPDFRTNTKKTHQVMILARDDWEIAEGDSQSIPMGEGLLDLGGNIGNVSYHKVDWKFTHTPGIDQTEVTNPDGSKSMTGVRENGKNQRAWAKAIQGFEMLGSAEFVITDRLHGHIMSTLIGTPHVLMDSKLKKNLNYHDTWTKDCGCTRVADNIEEAKNFARMYFEKKKTEEQGKNAIGASVQNF